MSGFVYLWFDRKHKRYYVGSHWGEENDGYICSSRWMRNAMRRRIMDFKRRIIARIETSRADLFVEEQRWLDMIKPEEIKKRYYNLMRRSQHWRSDEENAKTVMQKISEGTKLAMAEPSVRKRYLKGLKKRKMNQSPEVRAKRSASMKRTMAAKFPPELRLRYNQPKRDSAEHSENMSRNSKEMWNRPGYRENISAKLSERNKGKQYRLGQTNSPEHRAAISASLQTSAAVKQHAINMSKKRWWNNGKINRREETSPGADWVAGKISRMTKKQREASSRLRAEKTRAYWARRQQELRV